MLGRGKSFFRIDMFYPLSVKLRTAPQSLAALKAASSAKGSAVVQQHEQVSLPLSLAWLGSEDSNLGIRIQSPLSYR